MTHATRTVTDPPRRNWPVSVVAVQVNLLPDAIALAALVAAVRAVAGVDASAAARAAADATACVSMATEAARPQKTTNIAMTMRNGTTKTTISLVTEPRSPAA
ncbi:hypothetical protein ACIG87_15350 [Micromonospora sp. NPDC051925]|uniref:hypothetical protein n=1 Tax=Micromonospora sp. NPDC051925 TaxID=3364288 RepID=UPI0037C834FA